MGKRRGNPLTKEQKTYLKNVSKPVLINLGSPTSQWKVTWDPVEPLPCGCNAFLFCREPLFHRPTKKAVK